jgi:hypothetical protein
MLGCEGLGGILRKKAGTSELDVFYPITSECHADVPKTRFKLRVSSLPLPFGHLLISFLLHCENSLSLCVEESLSYPFCNSFFTWFC